MKNKRVQQIVLGILMVFAGLGLMFQPVMAASQVLVTTQWLDEHRGSPNLVIIDVRTETNYGFVHIPGAVSLPYAKWQQNVEEGCQLMPSPEAFTMMMQALGVNQNSQVVIYDHGNTISDASKGATAYWVLKAMGHDKVSYLDGGLTKWTFEGRLVDNVKPTPEPGNFVARFDPGKVATLEDIKAGLHDTETILVDTRNSTQHFGTEKRGDIERYGHIPGSLNFPAPFMTHAGINRAPATLKSKKDLMDMALGIGLPGNKSAPIILYCNSGQFAGLGYLVLHDMLGYRNVKVYDGSILQYCKADDGELPMIRFSWGHVTR